MFALWCPVECSRVLRWSSHVVQVSHPARGAIDLLVRCTCGQLALLRTGRARSHEEVVHGVGEQATAARALACPAG